MRKKEKGEKEQLAKSKNIPLVTFLGANADRIHWISTLFQVKDVEDFVAAIWPSQSCWSGKDGRSKGGIPKRLRSDPLSLSFPSVYNMFSFA